MKCLLKGLLVLGITIVAVQSSTIMAQTTVVAWGGYDHRPDLSDSYHFGQTNVPAGLTHVTAIAAGWNFSMVLNSDGTVVAWGDTTYGQTDVPGDLNGVTAISSAGYYNLALKSDGTVVAWGDMDVTAIGETEPPPGLTDVIAITNGAYHGLALKSDSTLVAWGPPEFDYGQATVPAGLTGVKAIAAGIYHNLALKSDGTVVAWGRNFHGQTDIPEGLTDVTAVAAGWDFSMALKSDGTVVVWGQDDYGQATIPGGLTGVTAIAAADVTGLALKSDGTVVVWGFDDAGQLDVPNDLTGVTAIAGGDYHILALSGSIPTPSITTTPFHTFGQVPLVDGTVTVTDSIKIKNTGTADLTVNPQNNMGDGFIVSPAPLTITPGDSVKLAVGLSASTAGRKDASLVITHNDADAGGQTTIALHAKVVERLEGTVVAWGAETNLPPGLTDVTAIAAGQDHNLALKSDGTVVAWGLNEDDQTDVPADLDSVTAISAGLYHSLALKSNGTVVAWGHNVATNVPVGLTDVVAIAGGGHRSFALKSDGTVIFWGDNSQDVGTVPEGLTGVTEITAAMWTALALKSDSTVAAWGVNSYGQLNVPAGLTGVKAIAAGRSYSMVLKSDGTVQAWGRNNAGQTDVPAGLTDVIAIASGDRQSAGYSLALKSDGTVVAWGQDSHGQATVPGHLTDVLAIAAGSTTSLALIQPPAIATSSLLTFGEVPFANGIAVDTLTTEIKNTGNGALSVSGISATGAAALPVEVNEGFSVTSSTSFTVAPGASVLVSVELSSTTAGRKDATLVITHNDDAAGGQTTIALHANVYELVKGRVAAWGKNDYGQTDVPESLTDITAIAGGFRHNIGLKLNGTVVAWGQNFEGVTDVPGDLTNVIAVSGGFWHSLALKSDGTVEAWGYNENNETDIPEGLTDVVALAGGAHHSLALKSDGTVEVWGLNDYDQMTVPAGLTDVTAIAAGDYHNLALKSDGTVVAWGNNNYSQTNIPAGLTDVTAIAAGDHHSIALKSDGTVEAWGYGAHGQDNVPGDLTNVTAVAAGQTHNLALKSDGTVVAWGSESDGETDVPTGLTDVIAVAGGWNHSLALTTLEPSIANIPASLPFGDVVVNTTAVDSVKVKNTGSFFSLSVDSIAVTGADSASFPTSEYTPLSIEPGDSAYVRVTYAPTAAGADTASMQLYHNADGSPTSIPLTGYGIGPVILSLGTAFGPPGDTLSIPVTLANPNTGRPVEGVQFDLVTAQPAWRTFAGVQGVPNGFEVAHNYVGDVLRVVMHSEDSSKLEPAPDTGLMTLRYMLTEAPVGSTNVLSLTAIEAVDTLAVAFPYTPSSGRLQTGIRGDLSLDGRVSISDVVLNVHLMIGKDAMPDSGTTAYKIADANTDHSIDVADVIRQINTILEIPFTRPLTVASGPVTVSLGDTRIGPDGRQMVPVLLDGGSMISGVQMTFTYDPALMTVGEVVKTEYDGGLIWQHHAADGVYTLVGYSLEPGKGLSASGPSFYLPVSIMGEDAETSVLTLTDVQLVDRSAYGLDVTLEGLTTTVNREVALPATFSLSGATPNPFNPSTTIAYEVPEQTHITLTVYNLLGQEVVRLVDQVQAAGRYEAVWNGTNITGAGVSSGIYLYRITSGSGYTETKRMTLVK